MKSGVENGDLAKFVKQNTTQIMIFLPYTNKFVGAEYNKTHGPQFQLV